MFKALPCAEFNSFTIVYDKDFEKYKALVFKELEELKRIQILTLNAYFNPEKLLKSKYYESVKELADVLNSNDKIILAYYKKNVNATDGKTISEVKSYLISYKLWNSLNKQVYKVPASAKPFNAFQKLFLSIDEICEEGPY